MNIRRAPLILIATTWISVDAALASHFQRVGPIWPDWLAALAVGAVFGQMACLCLWFVVSRDAWGVRTAASGVCLLAGSTAAASATGGPHLLGRWLALLVFCMLAIGVGLAAGRSRSTRFMTRSGDGAQAGLGGGRQFRILNLLSGTTCVAVVLGLRQWLELPSNHPLGLVGFCLLMALPSLVLLWLSTRGLVGWGLVASVVVFCPSLVLLLPLTGVAPRDLPSLAVLSLAQSGVILGTLRIWQIMTASAPSPTADRATLCLLEGESSG
jgi:hypothetical protein